MNVRRFDRILSLHQLIVLHTYLEPVDPAAIRIANVLSNSFKHFSMASPGWWAKVYSIHRRAPASSINISPKEATKFSNKFCGRPSELPAEINEHTDAVSVPNPL